MKIRNGFLIMDGKGGGHCVLSVDEFIAAFDVDDTQQGKFCQVIGTGVQLRVNHTASEVFNKISGEHLSPVGD